MLLTVGLSTYSSDDRFLVEHTRHLGNWALRIKNARKDDEGIYECQLSTHPPESIFIELRIVGECKQATNKAQLFNLCGSLTTSAFIHEAIVYDAVNGCTAWRWRSFVQDVVARSLFGTPRQTFALGTLSNVLKH